MTCVLYRRLIVKTALVISLACSPAGRSADSPAHPRRAVRVSSDGYPSFIDEPTCHPSDYFAHELRHYDYQHPPLDHKQQSFFRDTFSSRPIAEIAGFNVLQLEHLINDHDLAVKIPVVQRARGEYCEIYHQEWRGGLYKETLPAQVSEVDSNTLLFTADPIAGNSNWTDEHDWTFDKAGPIDLFASEKISEIQKKILPSGRIVVDGGGKLENLVYCAPVLGPAGERCCCARAVWKSDLFLRITNTWRFANGITAM
jgi:hypothetical protein